MAKYIDRDRLIREGWSLQRTYRKDATTMVCEMKKPEDFPAADVRPVVRGKWIKVGGFYTPGGDPVWECSECGKGRHVYGVEHGTYGADISDGQWVACPNCRADMMGGDAEWESTSSTTPE